MRIIPAAIAVAALAALNVPAAADAPAKAAPKGWSRYHSSDVTYPPGDVCSFGVAVKVVFDGEYVRTPRSFPDGSPRRQAYSGPLVVRLSNRATGKSVVRDLSAYGTFDYGRDGSVTFDAYGPVGVGFHAGDGLPKGYYVLRGYHRVHIDADGTRTVVVDRGSEENVCDALK